MEISIIHMTGPELKKVFTMSGLSGDAFAKRLGISRGGLYLLFKDKIVNDAIEAKIMGDEELNNFRQLSNRTPKDPEQEGMVQYNPSVIERIIQATVDSVQNASAAIELANRSLALAETSNKSVNEDAAIFRQLLKDLLEKSDIVFQKRK